MYNLSRLDPSYVVEVQKFIDAVKIHAQRTKAKHICCPCADCKNIVVFDNVEAITSHLVCRGFVEDYLIWTKHGEGSSTPYMRTTDNTASNINVEGPMPYLNECDAMPDINETHHAMPDVNQTHNSTSDVNETQHVNTDAIEDADFLEAIMNRCADPSIFFMKRMEALKKAAEEPLYDESKGCTKEWSTLRAVLQFLTIKARYGWSDASFNDLLRVLGDLLPKENKVPANTYYAKKLVSPLTMGVEKIHACRNHCILYRGDQYKDLDSCPNCGASRYKTNKDYREEENAASVSSGRKRKKTQTKTQQDKRSKPTSNIEVDYYALRRIPALVIWYLPVVDRLRCLFANPDDAELMTWHASDERKDDGKLRHPADAKQWQEFDKKYPDFAEDPRNVRFALSTDGMNPFAERSSTHSTWPVIMTIYNLPSWLCQKRKYLLLTILISGPTQPGVDMDVFLEPLMQEMQILWEVGVKMIDAFRKETFTLRAIIIVTINDYPALFSLSGQFKGKVGCVECIDGTWHVSLPPSNKIVYMRHRRWLPAGHKYRLQKMNKYFDNMDESKSTAPSGYSKGHRVYKIVENVKFVFGKKTKDGKPRKVVKANEGDTFKKKSIFFKYLSYWKDLDVRHAIDGMHVQKNVFDSVVGTLLDIKSKTKEGLNSRLDMQHLKIRKELHPVLLENGKYHLPAASYNLNREEKHAMCVWLKNLKVPSGFCSNIRSLVSMKDLTLTNYNSHDCHVMLTTFLPIAIRAINPVFLKMAITRLCYFFNKISEKVIIRDELESLQKFAAETLSQLEMCFPPSFFDIMVHLIVHLVPQIEALGPMYFHEMWTYERFMSILNGYMSNRAHPEGSMIEAYTTEEAIKSGGPLCNNLLKDQVSIGLPPLRHEGRLGGRGRMGRKSFIPPDYNIVLEVHYSILQQLIIMDPFTKQHMKELREENPGCTNDWVHKEHKRRFTAWLKNLDMTDESETIKILASGPSSQVISWQSYDISGFTFSTSFRDTKRMAQNSGVRCEAVDDTTGEETTYFGFIDDIWEVEYGPRLQIPVFRCRWVQDKHVTVDNYGQRVLDLSKVGYKDDPWILANRAAQVFYVEQILSTNEKKSTQKPKHVAIPGKQQIVGVDGVMDLEDVNQFSEMSLFTNFEEKIKNVEKSIPQTSLPWVRHDGQGRTVAR